MISTPREKQKKQNEKGHSFINLKALRSFVASVLMVVGIFEPFVLVHGFASPLPPGKHLGVIFHEVAGFYGSQDDKKLFSNLSEDRDKKRSRDLANKLLSKAKTAEPSVTADMMSLTTGAQHLEGLEHRMKTEQSLSRKIAQDAEDKHMTQEEAASCIGDVLRYTMILSEDEYQSAVPEKMSLLEQKGYEVVKFRNAWGGKFYQGVNVQLKNADGVPVELQFHTPQSYAIKQASHAVYEIRRSAEATAEEIAAATKASLRYNAMVCVPDGAKQISWPAA